MPALRSVEGHLNVADARFARPSPRAGASSALERQLALSLEREHRRDARAHRSAPAHRHARTGACSIVWRGLIERRGAQRPCRCRDQHSSHTRGMDGRCCPRDTRRPASTTRETHAVKTHAVANLHLEDSARVGDLWGRASRRPQVGGGARGCGVRRARVCARGAHPEALREQVSSERCHPNHPHPLTHAANTHTLAPPPESPTRISPPSLPPNPPSSPPPSGHIRDI